MEIGRAGTQALRAGWKSYKGPQWALAADPGKEGPPDHRWDRTESGETEAAGGRKLSFLPCVMGDAGG